MGVSVFPAGHVPRKVHVASHRRRAIAAVVLVTVVIVVLVVLMTSTTAHPVELARFVKWWTLLKVPTI